MPHYKVFLTFKHAFCRLVLRIATDDSKAVCRLSVKFGATLKSSRLLLERAKELGLDVIGVSFHVGSGCTDPETYSQAISDARYVFDVGVSGLIAKKNVNYTFMQKYILSLKIILSTRRNWDMT